MKIQTKCKNRGVELVKKSEYHFQLKGKLLVNYWPTARKAHINGTKSARNDVTWDMAINMCFDQPKAYGDKDKRKSHQSRMLRKRLIKKGANNCRWCNIPLILETSTLEHIIPLDLGGLDNANNRTLACDPCNQKRGNTMPELMEAENHES